MNTNPKQEKDEKQDPIPESPKKYFHVDNAAVYHEARKAYAVKGFDTPNGEKWPTATLTTSTKKLNAIAQLRPDPFDVEPKLSDPQVIEWQKRMCEHVMAMNDLTADVMDVISAVWLKQAKTPLDMAKLHADDFLRYRGLQLNISTGTGRRGGYRDEQRKEIAEHVSILAHTWITVFEMEITEQKEGKRGPYRRRGKWRGESAVVVIDSRFGRVEDKDVFNPYIWSIRPGGVFAPFLFGPGRQTALLSQKALEYDPYRQKWEKRLTRYLSYQWRIRQGKGRYLYPFTVETLLKAIGMEIDPENPNRTKERLERALDTLLRDGVIAAWQYEMVMEAIIGKPGWWKEWLTWKILIEPPQDIMDHYVKIQTPVRKKSVKLLTAQELSFSEQLKAVRSDRRLTQMQAAEEMGISQSELSQVECGKKYPSKETREKINQWLEKTT